MAKFTCDFKAGKLKGGLWVSDSVRGGMRTGPKEASPFSGIVWIGVVVGSLLVESKVRIGEEDFRDRNMSLLRSFCLLFFVKLYQIMCCKLDE
jgi:hypothetical protein